MPFLITLFLMLASCGVMDEGRYVNRDVGFSITGPKGWFKKSGGGGQLVRYTQGPWEEFPVFGVLLEDLLAPQKGSSILNVSKAILEDFQRSYKTKVIEPPEEVIINGIQGARFVLDVESVKRATNKVTWTRNLFYQFMKDGKIVSLMAMSESDQFGEYQETFENAVKSFQWIEK